MSIYYCLVRKLSYNFHKYSIVVCLFNKLSSRLNLQFIFEKYLCKFYVAIVNYYFIFNN